MRRMTPDDFRIRLAAGVLALVAIVTSGCAQHAAGDLRRRAAPFTLARDQAISAIEHARTSMPADSIDRLRICYSDVEQRANDYAYFLVGIVSDGTYDDATNARLSQTLGIAIGAFDDCELKLQRAQAPPNPRMAIAQATTLPVLSTDWVSGFSSAVATAWQRDRHAIRGLSADEKAELVNNVQSDLIWPDFAVIPATPTPSPTN